MYSWCLFFSGPFFVTKLNWQQKTSHFASNRPFLSTRRSFQGYDREITCSGFGSPNSGRTVDPCLLSCNPLPWSAGIARASDFSGVGSRERRSQGGHRFGVRFGTWFGVCAARIHCGERRGFTELCLLGCDVSETTVDKYMIRDRQPSLSTWRTFLDNHLQDIVAIDFFTVPTATFRMLFALVVLRHDRRMIVHSNVTEHPTAEWTTQQIIEAFPEQTAPRFLIRDRDGIYGAHFRNRVKHMGIKELVTARRSPWQNPFVERLIGSIPRECLNHVIVLNERHLRRILRSYFVYYHESRTHLSLKRNSPIERKVDPPENGKVIAIPQVGGLHHRYRRAA